MVETYLELGDPWGLYLESGFHYLDKPLDRIFLVRIGEVTFEDLLCSLNHEYLHAVISNRFSPKEASKINYGLDTIIFTLGWFNSDLSREGS